MTEAGKQKAEAAAVTGVGAGVGTAGGATVGVLELAAQGTATALSAGVVIGCTDICGLLDSGEGSDAEVVDSLACLATRCVEALTAGVSSAAYPGA